VRRALVLSCVLLACAGGGAIESTATPEANDGGGGNDASPILPDGGPDPDAPSDAASGARPLPPVPLHTQGRWILDANDERIKLASVNWYGAESKDFVVAGLDKAPLATIAAQIRAAGFNSVRLPWSNELLETNPPVAAARVSANPTLAGKPAMDVFDAVIAALAFEGLVVVIDNHVSKAEWCCTEQDGNGLWFTPEYPESKWLDDWRTMAKRYRNVPAVIGAELRNELRGMPDGRKPNWGGSDATLDWRAAAKRGGDAVLEEHPGLLVMIDGLEYSTDLTGAYDKPISLAVANRLVWAPHDYAWFHPGLASTAQLKTDLGQKWGFLLVQDQPYTAPVWISEFGIAHTPSEVSSLWFTSFLDYLDDADEDWAYWALNGTQSTGTTRTLGAEETFGVLDTSWSNPASSVHLGALQSKMPRTQKP
jgi:endoglucanase